MQGMQGMQGIKKQRILAVINLPADRQVQGRIEIHRRERKERREEIMPGLPV
jgi:hypothetical protein